MGLTDCGSIAKVISAKVAQTNGKKNSTGLLTITLRRPDFWGVLISGRPEYGLNLALQGLQSGSGCDDEAEGHVSACRKLGPSS